MKVLYIPLDERPCNLRYPQDIATINNEIQLVVPPTRILGLKKTPAKVELIKQFILDHYQKVDIFICSIDMLCYGGLIPSRLHHDTTQEISSRLLIFKELKQNKPDLKIYPFSSIMRTPGYSSNDEEPDYYEQYGYEIYKTKYLEDKKLRSILTTEEQTEYDSLTEIPPDIITDYEKRRELNNNNLIQVLHLLSDQIFDNLVIFQDDSAPYGYTANDQKTIKNRILKLNLEDQVYIYPGADEVGCSLLLRAFNDYNELRPRVYCEYASVLAKQQIPLYEDRPMYETLKHHISVVGAIMVDHAQEADYVLMINSPGLKMQESWDQFDNKNNEYDSYRNLKYFTEKIEYFTSLGYRVMIADVAYANGGDIELIERLDKKDLLAKIYGYAGWNTHANTLGTVLGTAMVTRKITDETLRNVQMHILEDGYYQAKIRMDITKKVLPNYELSYFDLKDKQKLVVEEELKLLNEVLSTLKVLSNITINNIKLSHPWNRMFEIDLEIVN